MYKYIYDDDDDDGKGEGQHQRLQHQEPAVEPTVPSLPQRYRHHQQRFHQGKDSLHPFDQRHQGSYQELETGDLHPAQRDHQGRHQSGVLHQDSREHQEQDSSSRHHQMSGGHRRHLSQQRLGWLPLLCLQGIFQLLPEALGQPSHLLHQAQSQPTSSWSTRTFYAIIHSS